MNCEKFQTVASDVARAEMMQATDRAGALAHIDECPKCGQALADQQELSDGLRLVAEQTNSLQAPAQLEETLRSAFRDQTLVRQRRSAPRHWRYWASAVAAALLIAFGIMAWRAHVASLPQPPLQANHGSGSPPVGPPPKEAKVVNPETPADHKMAPKNLPRRPHLALNRANKHSNSTPPAVASAPVMTPDNEKEITTDFVALGYGSAMDLQDGGQLVRVQLPRSALARFGLPVNMDRVDERVKADVLVGADGLARAIRFVK